MVEPADHKGGVYALASGERPNDLQGEMGLGFAHEFIKGLLGQKPLRGQVIGPALFPSRGALIKLVVQIVLSVLGITAQVGQLVHDRSSERACLAGHGKPAAPPEMIGRPFRLSR